MSVDFCTLQTYCLDFPLTVYLPKTTVVKILICIETRGSEVDNRFDLAPPDCVDDPQRVLKKSKEFFKKKYNEKVAVERRIRTHKNEKRKNKEDRNENQKCEVKVSDLTLTGFSCQMLNELHLIVSDNSCTFAPKSITVYDKCGFSATSDWVVPILGRFDQSGNFTFTIPPEVNSFFAIMIGGGGAGAPGIGGSVNVGGGGGGGGGQLTQTSIINVEDLPSRTIFVIVGSGGTASNRNGQGSFILDSNEQTLFSAGGGFGGVGHNGGNGLFGGGGGAPNGRGGSRLGQNASGRNGGSGGGSGGLNVVASGIGGVGGLGSPDGFGGGGGGAAGRGGNGGSGREFGLINGRSGIGGGGGGGGGYFQGNIGTGGNGGTGVIILFRAS